jgi:hypothetical protein
MKTDTIRITPELLALLSELDEFNLKTAVKGDQNGVGAQKRTGF